MSVDELLAVVQAAGMLGIQPWTLRHWIGDRKMDVVTRGNGRAVYGMARQTCALVSTRPGSFR
jgi:hypothetical protein